MAYFPQRARLAKKRLAPDRALSASLQTLPKADVMQLIFTKGSGKYDQVDIVRPGREVESVPCPKQGIIPHEMVHFAVESTMQKRGFLGRIREGEKAIFQMQAEAESDSIERLVEVIQGDAWSGSTGSANDMLAMYQVTCSARECPCLSITAVDIDAIRASVASLTAQWDAVAIAATLVLDF
jgi:hypothetical protein